MKWLDIWALCLLSVFGDWAIFDVLYALTFFRYRESPGKNGCRLAALHWCAV
ncbi:MAG: hypothetical protein ACLT3Y_06275 [Ruminococcus callidus]